MSDEYRHGQGGIRDAALTPRRYTLGKRAASAQSTRDRVLHVAGDLVARHGVAAVTIEEVARRAGVARVTVYNHFDSKARLLEALAWAMFEGADISGVRAARMEPDVGGALRGFVAENARFLAALGPQARAVLAAALDDHDVRAVVGATYVGGRRAAIVELVHRLTEAGRLPPNWSPERAVASLMVLTSLEALETLTAHLGWSAADAGELLADIAGRVLDP